MDAKTLHTLYLVFLYMLYAPWTSLMGQILFSIPFTWKRTGIIFIIVITFRLVITIFFYGTFIGYCFFFISVYMLCAFPFGFGMRTKQCMTAALILLTLTILFDFFVQILAYSNFSYEEILVSTGSPPVMVLRSSIFPIYTIFSLISMSSVLIIMKLFLYITSKLAHLSLRAWVRAVRPIVFTIVILLFTFKAALNFERSLSSFDPTAVLYAIKDELFFFVALIVLIFYVIEDFKSLRLSLQNKTLHQQQRIYEALLSDIRIFRHNIANMLYGFEGKILSGNIHEIQEYYDQMAHRCARINNENAVALSRIPSAAVNALLLNKIQTANELEIPIYLNVEENLRWKGIKDSDMCQVLGILIDNAIEAAQSGNIPYVAIEVSRVENAMEIIIRNTYDMAHADLSFLLGNTRSTKDGHEGLGISSVKGILAKHGNVIMNQIQRGRYIETLLLFE